VHHLRGPNIDIKGISTGQNMGNYIPFDGGEDPTAMSCDAKAVGTFGTSMPRKKKGARRGRDGRRICRKLKQELRFSANKC
jgi:hypothetical protein